MPSADLFEIRDGRLGYHPTGPISVHHLIELLKNAMDACLEHNQRRLLFDARGLDGPQFSTLQGYEIATGVEHFWDKRIKLAVLNRPEWQAMDSFALNVLENRGLVAGIFDSEADALAWLKAP